MNRIWVEAGHLICQWAMSNPIIHWWSPWARYIAPKSLIETASHPIWGLRPLSLCPWHPPSQRDSRLPTVAAPAPGNLNSWNWHCQSLHASILDIVSVHCREEGCIWFTSLVTKRFPEVVRQISLGHKGFTTQYIPTWGTVWSVPRHM